MTSFESTPRRRFATVVAAVSILSVGYPAMAAGATTLWYNGDIDQRDAITNQTGAADGIVYDNFVVPVGKTYTISAVFSNDAMYGAQASTAYWEIRSGVSAGNRGTLVASGDWGLHQRGFRPERDLDGRDLLAGRCARRQQPGFVHCHHEWSQRDRHATRK
jgi:hypothetical protein